MHTFPFSPTSITPLGFPCSPNSVHFTPTRLPPWPVSPIQPALTPVVVTLSYQVPFASISRPFPSSCTKSLTRPALFPVLVILSFPPYPFSSISSHPFPSNPSYQHLRPTEKSVLLPLKVKSSPFPSHSSVLNRSYTSRL